MAVIPIIQLAADVDPAQLDAFLSSRFSPAKVAFLRRHADWWYGGPQNRWVLLVGDQIAGYCAVMPACLWVNGERVPAVWWLDLIVAPEFRGQGLQRLFDERVRALTDLKVGFPNELAAKIHRKHQWGVRSDLQVRMLPVAAEHIRAVRAAGGWRGEALRWAAQLARPFFDRYRFRISRYRPSTARREDEVGSETLAAIFYRFAPPNLCMTYRDAAHFERRYFAAPYRNELAFYLAGPSANLSHYLIARHVRAGGRRITRILDWFGNLEDQDGLVDLLRLAAKDAVSDGSVQVTLMASVRAIIQAARAAGFFVRSTARFCWHSQSLALMKALAGPGLWVLGDSDNDEPA